MSPETPLAPHPQPYLILPSSCASRSSISARPAAPLRVCYGAAATSSAGPQGLYMPAAPPPPLPGRFVMSSLAQFSTCLPTCHLHPGQPPGCRGKDGTAVSPSLGLLGVGRPSALRAGDCRKEPAWRLSWSAQAQLGSARAARLLQGPWLLSALMAVPPCWMPRNCPASPSVGTQMWKPKIGLHSQAV